MTPEDKKDGAGDGNRTHAKSLGSSYSTIELHPPVSENPQHNQEDNSASSLKNHPGSTASNRLKSTVLRQGRMTKAQDLALKEGFKQYGIDFGMPFDIQSLPFPKTLEIGFGMGDSLFIQATEHPDHFYIGIEVHKPGVGSLIARCLQEKLSNIKIFCHDAREVLEKYIPAHSLDKIQIFFPDPWPKKRHHKRRLIQAEFLMNCYEKLKPRGILHIATDWADYADHILAVFSELNQHYQTDLTIQTKHSRPETKFERRGKKLGHTIWDFVYEAVKTS